MLMLYVVIHYLPLRVPWGDILFSMAIFKYLQQNCVLIIVFGDHDYVVGRMNMQMTLRSSHPAGAGEK